MKKPRTTHVEISACKARARLPELLRQVRGGRRFTMTNRGQAIADLVPSAAAAIDRFRAFLSEHPVKARDRINVRTFIEEGRE